MFKKTCLKHSPCALFQIGVSKEVCLFIGVDWSKVIFQSEGVRAQLCIWYLHWQGYSQTALCDFGVSLCLSLRELRTDMLKCLKNLIFFFHLYSMHNLNMSRVLVFSWRFSKYMLLYCGLFLLLLFFNHNIYLDQMEWHGLFMHIKKNLCVHFVARKS